MAWMTRNRDSGLFRFALFFILFAVAIPWYWSWFGWSPDARLWGMPTWFVVAVVGSFAISALTAWQLRKPWEAELAAAKESPEP
jgi:hypothetical protein